MAVTSHSYQAIGVSPGIAIGRVIHIHTHGRGNGPVMRRITADQVPAELAKLAAAQDATRRQLAVLKSEVGKKLQSGDSEIFDAHLLLVDDRALIGDIEKRIREELIGAECAIHESTEHFIGVFSGMQDEYLKERAVDLRDVAARIMTNLSDTAEDAPDLDDRRIIVATTLTPSETVRFTRDRILGFATATGSATSHAAILARSMQVPAVVGVPQEAIDRLDTGARVIIDGFSGRFIVNPDSRTEEAYRVKQRSTGELLDRLAGESRLRSETPDGFLVELAANIDDAGRYEEARAAGANGVGLFRTEFLFMDENHLPGENEQFEIYRRLLIAAGDAPVTIRTMDVGGDKFSSAVFRAAEANPFLGLRGIRLCLEERRDLFEIQLRALLRAGVSGNLRVMLPMVSSSREILETRKIIAEQQRTLKAAGIDCVDHLSLGAMIETPAAALTADTLAGLVDFFSIGTNDLVQYTMAIDRGNERVAHLYQPSHPAIIKLIRNCVEAARSRNIFVSVCGQMAGDPVFTPLLIGLGVHELSMSADALAVVRRVIRSMPLYEAEAAVEAAAECADAAESLTVLRELLRRRAPEIAEIQ